MDSESSEVSLLYIFINNICSICHLYSNLDYKIWIKTEFKYFDYYRY